MILFADSTPSANNVLNVVVYLFMAGSALATIGLWWQGRKPKSDKREITPQPLEISKASKRYNHDAIDGRIKTVEGKVQEHSEQIGDLRDKLSDDLPAMERRLNEAGESRSSEIHGRINDILKEVSKLGGKMDSRS